MSKLYKLILFFGVALTASTFAIPRGPCDVKETCCEEIPAGPYAFSYPKDVGLACPRDFHVHGEFLWMKASEDGLEYAMDQDRVDSTLSYEFPLVVGKVKGFSSDSQEWDWRPGFRVGFGFYSNHDAWNLDVNWTYLRIKADSEVDNGGSGNLLPFFLPPTRWIAAIIPHASARWSGDLNTMDIAIGKPYHVSRYFVSNPSFGIRTAWLDQDYHVRYFQILDGGEIKRNVYHKNDFWGVGIRGAYETDFLLGAGLFIYGKAAFSMLFGKFDTSQQAEVPGFATEEMNYKTESCFYRVQSNSELSMGLSWSSFFCKNQYKIAIKAGYEFHSWWSQNKIRRFFFSNPGGSDIVSCGDLSFNGFMFGLNLDF